MPVWLWIVIAGWAGILVGFVIGMMWNNPEKWKLDAEAKEEVIMELCGKLEEYRERIRKIEEELK